MLGNLSPNRSLDVQSYMQFQYNLMRASALAVRTYRQMGYDGIIGASTMAALSNSTRQPSTLMTYFDTQTFSPIA